LAEEPGLALIEKEVNAGNLFQVVEQEKPDMILLDFEFQPHPLNLVDKLADECPQCAVIAVLSEAESENLDRVVLSGARAFIQYPYPPKKLAITLKRVAELQVRDKGRSPEAAQEEEEAELKSNRVFTVFSPKGGAGTTTIATNLAISLQEALKEDVLLIDGKHLFGHVALYLNLRSGNSLTDLLPHVGMLDERLIRQVAVKHNSGIYVLPSPNAVAEAQGIRPEDLFKVLQALQEVFPNIIIDGGSTINENTVTYLDMSDKIILVMSPDLASMRDARQFMDIAASLSYPKEKTLLLLNLAGRKADVKTSEIERILRMDVFGTIPADENLALSSINEGVPILLKKRRHPISRAFIKITKDLLKLIRK
jgi:pilus assembly protein CpaE